MSRLNPRNSSQPSQSWQNATDAVVLVAGVDRRNTRLTFSYLQIAIGALFNVSGEVLLKRGSSAALVSGGTGLFGFAALSSAWTWIGIACYILALLNWLWVLRTVPVSIAFSLINCVYVLVPLAAHFLLHEPIHARRWLGIILVLCGALLIVKPLALAEQKL